MCRGQVEQVLDLGNMALTGHFPRLGEHARGGPVRLNRCVNCGVVQLGEDYNLKLLYGDNYGYRSGLNSSMARHLMGIAQEAEQWVKLYKGDLIIDIGSNDGTLLRGYTLPPSIATYVGVDPTADKFAEHYQDHVYVISEFFSARAVRCFTRRRMAKIITTIACFYDLTDPQWFVEQLLDCLADDGIWISEQSYLPAIIDNLAYDTICHEHLEYYRLRDFVTICERHGLRILRVSENDVNGGSFRVTMCREEAPYVGEQDHRITMLEREKKEVDFEKFRQRMKTQRNELQTCLHQIKKQGRTVWGYGASTKGNVILQYCDIYPDLLPCIVEINPDKVDRVTPGTEIPIIGELPAKLGPDAYLVLPWHFKDHICRLETEFLDRGGELIFPLPYLHVLSYD